MLRGGDDGRLRRVRHHDSASGGRLDVDVVDAHSGPADHLQAVRSLEHVGGQLRRRADHDRVVGADLLGEVAVRLDVDVEPLPQQLDTRVGDRLADQDALGHTRARSSKASSALVTATPRSISAPRSASTISTAASAVVMSKTSK